MSTMTSTLRHTLMLAWIGRLLRWLDGIPYTLLAIPLRFAIATVFWNSAMAHLANWQTTIYLFETEYKLPIVSSNLRC